MGPYGWGWRSYRVGPDLSQAAQPVLGRRGGACQSCQVEPSTQKSRAFSHLIGPGNWPFSRLPVAQRVCSLLTCGKAGPGEPHYACFHFPILEYIQHPRVNSCWTFITRGFSQAGQSATHTVGNQQSFLRWGLRHHLDDLCLILREVALRSPGVKSREIRKGYF